MFIVSGSHRRILFRKTSFIVALLFGAAWFGASEGQAQRAGKRGDLLPAVTLSDVKIERMNERVAAVGSGRARQQVTLTTRVAGVIDQVLFEGGQLVDANQALVKLNADTEAIAVETAQAQRAQAADTVARYKQLNEGTIAKVAIAEADTALKVADANLRKAKDDLDRMTIKAPFKGIMGLSTLEAGDYLAVGSPIARAGLPLPGLLPALRTLPVTPPLRPRRGWCCTWSPRTARTGRWSARWRSRPRRPPRRPA